MILGWVRSDGVRRVGISGHALHGGFGFMSRMWGTTLDNVLEMEVVLANGDIVTVSKESNPDLFWVCFSFSIIIGS